MAIEHAAETTPWTERFRRGDEDCLRQLRDGFCPLVCRILELKFGRRRSELIEQAVGAAMWTAWRLRARYDPVRGAFAAWFYSIAKGHCLELLRKRARNFELTISPEELDRLTDTRARLTGCDGLDIDDSSQQAAACLSGPGKIVRAALASLPRCQRAVLTADGESPNGRADTHPLAVELGVCDSAIRQSRRRGRQRLKTELERRGIEKFLGASRAERINGGANPRRPKRKTGRTAGR